MKKFLIIGLIALLIASCNTKNRNFNNFGDLIEVNIDSLGLSNSDTSLISSITYIPLKKDSNTLISRIDKILYVNNKFYILDSSLKTLFVFDESGDLLCKLRKIGRGPGEYIGIYGFDVDDEENIYIYDNMSSKIIKYSTDFKNYNEIGIKYYFEEFLIIKDGLVLRNMYDNGEITSHLATLNLKSNKVDVLIDKKNYIDDFSLTRFGMFSLFKSNQNTYFNPRFTNKIYKISNTGELTQKMNIYGDYPNREFIESFKNNPAFGIAQDKYIVDIRNIYETSSMFILNIRKGINYNLLISKKSSKSILTARIFDRNYFGDNLVYGIADDAFISLTNPNLIMENNWIENVINSTLCDEDKQMLINKNIEDNPTLILIKFKDF